MLGLIESLAENAWPGVAGGGQPRNLLPDVSLDGAHPGDRTCVSHTWARYTKIAMREREADTVIQYVCLSITRLSFAASACSCYCIPRSESDGGGLVCVV